MALRYAMIMAGGVGSRLCVLSDKRAKPAAPFAGKYRIIDFTLSNCVNSGFTDVDILTQYKPMSLNQHIGIGKPWDLDRRHGGVRLLQPYIGWEATGWYKGTADAVYQNLHELRNRDVSDVLILSGDHVYKMDYNRMFEFHAASGAALTVGVIPVPPEDAHKFGMVEAESDGRVSGFVEKPRHAPRTSTASMGVYLFDTRLLIDVLEADATDPESQHDFGKNVIPALVESGKVFAFKFDGYWRDIGTLDSYYQANLDLAAGSRELDLHDPRWRIHTVDTSHQPVKFVGDGGASGSLLSNGCIVYGEVRDSVLSPGVVIERGARVHGSILFNDTWVGPRATLNRVIVDKNVHVGAGCRLGVDLNGGEAAPNERCPQHLHTGLTVVGKNARLPEGLTVGRNVRIGSEVHGDHFTSGVVPASSTVAAPDEPGH